MKTTKILLGVAALALIPACSSSPDARLSRLVQDSTHQQAQQNQKMADANRTVSDNHRRVVEAVETSRKEIVALERDVREQVDRLDEERRDLAAYRQNESLLVPILETCGTVLVAALPLVICLYLLHGLSNQPNDDEVHEVVMQQWLEANNGQVRIGENEPPQSRRRVGRSRSRARQAERDDTPPPF